MEDSPPAFEGAVPKRTILGIPVSPFLCPALSFTPCKNKKVLSPSGESTQISFTGKRAP
ncbi:hypothetical protein HMPREF0262_01082 [Clostridium sp. ATCC 29733]|nr:hypothetical protein HMPREF0262_01082 [Clostridium sp. ATCC 29733]